MCLVSTGKQYIKFNPQVSTDLNIRDKSRWYSLINELRDKEWGKHLVRGNTDNLHSTLVLVGFILKGTRWHIDWMQAFNVAWLLGKVSFWVWVSLLIRRGCLLG